MVTNDPELRARLDDLLQQAIDDAGTSDTRPVLLALVQRYPGTRAQEEAAIMSGLCSGHAVRAARCVLRARGLLAPAGAVVLRRWAQVRSPDHQRILRRARRGVFYPSDDPPQWMQPETVRGSVAALRAAGLLWSHDRTWPALDDGRVPAHVPLPYEVI